MSKAYGVIILILLALAGGAVTSQHARSDVAPGKKCECFDGAADCFFDGKRCPVSGGKCKCFKAPSAAVVACGCGADHEGLHREHDVVAAAAFCEARCPKTVGGEKCGAQCRLTKGHSGMHMCIKLHDF